MAPELQQLTNKLIQFRDERDWAQFHTLKNLTAALSVEAAELLELTQWRTDVELEAGKLEPMLRMEFSTEVADVFLYLLLIGEKLGIDIIEAAEAKLIENGRKYPADKARGTAKKYSEL